MRLHVHHFLLLISCASAFVSPLSQRRRPLSSQLLVRSSSTTPAPTNTQEVDQLKHEIEEMKAEALRRMQALELQLSQQDDAVTTQTQADDVAVPQEEPLEAAKDIAMSSPPSSSVDNSKDLAPREVTVSSDPQTTQSSVVTNKNVAIHQSAALVDEASLLDDTRWKVMLNIGRETGTWMPKTWGISGERLLVNVEVEFTSDQLYEREEFLNGIANAKELEVHHVDLGPTLSEDSRHVKFKETGGWRVARGEGPMGTDVLRFYIEIEEDVRHQGSDVYCPKGRIYCTCGYFPMHQPSGLQDRLREEQANLAVRYDDLSREMESANVFDKLKIGKDMLDVRMEIGRVTDQLNEVRVREPEKSLLRLSRKRDVGLTKEGGVCCKVAKGLAVEYHILGKFGVASIEKREEIEQENLRP